MLSFQKIITGLLVFCVILFFYLHIQFHLKTCNDLEVYEIEDVSKERLEEICDLRQPILYNTRGEMDTIVNTTNKSYLVENYPIFEIKIREQNNNNKNESEVCVPLQLLSAQKLFEKDHDAKYFSESNGDFLTETGAIKNMAYNDQVLRPYLVSNCNYDVMFASDNFCSPLRYELNYRNYFLVTQGSVTVKLVPPKYSRYLYTIYDYEQFEFRSPINAWEPQIKYKADYDKVKSLEISLTPGRLLYIPAYWWYSFKFGHNTSVSCFRYRTYMNNIAICPHIGLYALQNQNVERKIAKHIQPNSLNPPTADQQNNGDQNEPDTESFTNIQDLIPSEQYESAVEPNITAANVEPESTNISDIPDILIPVPQSESLGA